MRVLADMAAMSQASFYHYFKVVTHVSPVQYIKAIRLHEARRKMCCEGLNAADAAFQVGYVSPSQFCREYKRLFGLTPGQDKTQFDNPTTQGPAQREYQP